jgi:two-component sensor histidine kinase
VTNGGRSGMEPLKAGMKKMTRPKPRAIVDGVMDWKTVRAADRITEPPKQTKAQMPDKSPKEISVNVPPSTRGGMVAQWWWMVSAFWLLIAVASALESWLLRSVDLRYAVRFAAWQWLPWMVLSPAILWLGSAFTIERPAWFRNFLIHLAACAVLVCGLGTLDLYEGPGPGGPPQFHHGEPPHDQGHDQQPSDWSGQTNFNDGGHGFPSDGGDHHPHPGMDHGHPQGGPGGFGPHGHPPSLAMMILGRAGFQLPTFWAMVGVAHALVFYRRSKDRERRGLELRSQLTQARLQALRMQLNPHFLFNTLNSIASLVYDQPRIADEMIGSLSDLLRLTLTAPDRQEVTLREELNFLDQYLFIEQTRFGEKLRVEKDIEPAALEAMAPILILQPLVENAVKHGVEAQLAPGVVRIAARRAGDFLRLEVTDNGRGLAGAKDGKVVEGVGLSNTRARLRELYAERGSLGFGARPEGGFSVSIQIPWRTAAAPGQTAS